MVWTSAEPSLPIPQYGGFGAVISEKLFKYGNRLALVDGPTGQGYTYAELNKVIRTVAGNLYHNAGIRKGDVVLLYLPNSMYYAILMMAVPSIGGIITGCNPFYTTAEVLRQAKDANAVYLVTTSERQNMLPDFLAGRPQIRSVFIVGDNVDRTYIPINDLFAPGQPAPDVHIDNLNDLALLPYSSGTTGLPKGVIVTHHSVIAGVLSAGPQGASALGEGTEVMVVVFPLFHIGGAVNILVGLLSGAKLIFYPNFDFETFLEANHKYKTTGLGLPPPVCVRLAKDPLVKKYNFSSLKNCIMGAAPVSRETLEEMKQRIPSLTFMRQSYGLTETAGVTHITRLNDIKLGSVGTVVPNVQCMIADTTTGEELPPGQTGEVCIGGDTVMKGYLNNPEATVNTFKNGWLHTGDIGYVDESGHLFIVDRLKELIKYKGFQVPPAELEALLLTHPDIAEVAVTGVPDSQAGELPRAFVVLKSGCKATEKDIQNFVKSHVAPYKQLRGGVEFVSEVPKSPSGKLLRRILKDRVKAAALKAKI